MGAKGGAGVTTVACNFAVALAQEPGQKTLLIDLDLPFGDAALNLGVISEFSTIDALQERTAGWKLSFQAAGQAQLGNLRACGSGKISALPGDQRGH
jgi:MinD-like ATPase involved in chromosome partitioning or flagellar assembly